MADTRCHALARLAVEDCMAQVDFSEVLIFSDRNLEVPGTIWHSVSDWPNKDVAQEFLWNEVPFMVNTTHFLFCEWDAWIINAGRWRDEFLIYDYVGAPWSWQKINSVGNGGFSLRSVRMTRHVVDNPMQYPVRRPFIHDELLCRDYRPALEVEGFMWAPEELARQFSFETRHDCFDTFGFHAMYNWPMVISGDKLRERVRIARETEHIRKTQAQHLERLPWA